MQVRVTPLVNFTRIKFDLARSFERLSSVQGMLSSGKRIHVMSDDPARATRALDVRGSLARTARTLDNVALARQAADAQAGALEEVTDLLAQAREKAEDAASGTKTQADLDTLAGEIDAILEQLVSLANRNQQGRYLFAGSQVATMPFQATKGPQGITSVAYHGDDVARQVRLGPGELKDMELSGLDVFFKIDRKPTKITGSTGLLATPGANDTMIRDALITLRHLATTVGDAAGAGGSDSISGLANGASSAANTILGTHKVTIESDGTGKGSIALDGGAKVLFNGDETDLVVTNAAGDKIHVDVSGVGASFAGDVTLTGNGEIAAGDGPAVALGFTSDFALKDAAGRTIHLDTTAVQRTGEDFAVFPGTTSVFDVLIGLRDDLRGKAGLDPMDAVARTVTRLAALDRSRDDLLGALSSLGAKSAAFERIEGSLELFQLALTEKQSQLEDTDFFEASISLSQATATYQSALQVAALISTAPTLADYL